MRFPLSFVCLLFVHDIQQQKSKKNKKQGVKVAFLKVKPMKFLCINSVLFKTNKSQFNKCYATYLLISYYVVEHKTVRNHKNVYGRLSTWMHMNSIQLLNDTEKITDYTGRQNKISFIKYVTFWTNSLRKVIRLLYWILQKLKF